MEVTRAAPPTPLVKKIANTGGHGFATISPDNATVVAAATIPFMNGAWGSPTTLVPAGPDKKTNLFPMHSPDGKWIAYARGKGGHGDLTSQLWLVPAKGGTPVELVNGNRVVSNAMGDGLTENSQPTWAPPGDYNWIAFNSQREYGLVSPKGTQQIWVAAVDLAKAARGEDPSYPRSVCSSKVWKRTTTAPSGHWTCATHPRRRPGPCPTPAPA